MSRCYECITKRNFIVFYTTPIPVRLQWWGMTEIIERHECLAYSWLFSSTGAKAPLWFQVFFINYRQRTIVASCNFHIHVSLEMRIRVSYESKLSQYLIYVPLPKSFETIVIECYFWRNILMCCCWSIFISLLSHDLHSPNCQDYLFQYVNVSFCF